MAFWAPLVAAGAPQPEANGPAVFSRSVPYGSRLLRAKFQLLFATVLRPNRKELENFALNFHFGKP